MTRKDPTEKTIKRLFALSWNKCAFPWCNLNLVSSENNTIIANICHIEAAEKWWERYNPKQTDDDRRHFDNLILLCANHHIETDDVWKYSVDVLKKMKKEHEDKYQLNAELFNKIQKYPSLLGELIKKISRFDNDLKISSEVISEFKINNKVQYNKIVRYKPIINQYKNFYWKLNTIFNEFDNNGDVTKIFLYEQIKTFYENAKIEFWIIDNNISLIQENADNIIDYVKSKLMDIIETSNNLDDIPIEIINVWILIIIIESFIKCNILEEPPKI